MSLQRQQFLFSYLKTLSVGQVRDYVISFLEVPLSIISNCCNRDMFSNRICGFDRYGAVGFVAAVARI